MSAGGLRLTLAEGGLPRRPLGAWESEIRAAAADARDDETMSTCLNQLALIYTHRGELERAGLSCRAHIRWCARRGGPDGVSPRALQPWLNLLRLEQFQGRPASALLGLRAFDLVLHAKARDLTAAERARLPFDPERLAAPSPKDRATLEQAYLVECMKAYVALGAAPDIMQLRQRQADGSTEPVIAWIVAEARLIAALLQSDGRATLAALDAGLALPDVDALLAFIVKAPAVRRLAGPAALDVPALLRVGLAAAQSALETDSHSARTARLLRRLAALLCGDAQNYADRRAAEAALRLSHTLAVEYDDEVDRIESAFALAAVVVARGEREAWFARASAELEETRYACLLAAARTRLPAAVDA